MSSTAIPWIAFAGSLAGALIAAAVAITQIVVQSPCRSVCSQKLLVDQQESVLGLPAVSHSKLYRSHHAVLGRACAGRLEILYAVALPEVFLAVAPQSVVLQRHLQSEVRDWLGAMETLSNRRFALPLGLEPAAALRATTLLADIVSAARDCLQARHQVLRTRDDEQRAVNARVTLNHSRFVDLSWQLVTQVTTSLFVNPDAAIDDRSQEATLADALLRSGVQSIPFSTEAEDPCWFAIWEIVLQPEAGGIRS